MNNIFHGLNEEQKTAAQIIQGPLLILAGAGSGKTKTITTRVANMILRHKIHPEKILAISFTNKAAAEMGSRIKKVLPRNISSRPHTSTFHALSLKILKEDIHHLGYAKRFTIYDMNDSLSIINEALKKYKNDKAYDKRTIQSKISFLKNQYIGPEEFESSQFFDHQSDYDLVTLDIYRYYQEKLFFCSAVDFDDILFLACKLFAEQPQVAQKYSEKYQYIMIDEYQDTNELQFRFTKFLTSTHQNICVVGDDDQSIYAFRGANIKNILNFEHQYSETKIIKLEKNYRSVGSILTMANTIVKENKKRKEKSMQATREPGPLPRLWNTQDTIHESQIVVEDIYKAVREGVDPNEICILFRSNTQIPPFEDQLRLNMLNYKIFGGQKFYDKKEIKDLIAYLCVILNHRDEVSLRRILNVPNRSIGTATLKNLLEEAKERNTYLFKVIQTRNGYDKRSIALNMFANLISKHSALFRSQSLSKSLEELIQDLHYEKYIERSYDSTKLINIKKNDLKAFVLSAKRFEEIYKEKSSLKAFVEKILLADASETTKETEEEKNEASISLMSIHASKGLEFERVYLVGAEEELLPHKKVIVNDEDIDEERRLCYVAVTRAKTDLFITYCKEREIYGKKVKRNLSRFFHPLPKEYFDTSDRATLSHLSAEEKKAYTDNFFANLADSLN